ncbi:hypothetical protein GCM10010106_28850 [Thermopolyspora flexuosa]|nr:hypothetical protein GCM10010106_28850 [Thermopolyspora flexuosa]
MEIRASPYHRPPGARPPYGRDTHVITRVPAHVRGVPAHAPCRVPAGTHRRPSDENLEAFPCPRTGSRLT